MDLNLEALFDRVVSLIADVMHAERSTMWVADWQAGADPYAGALD